MTQPGHGYNGANGGSSSTLPKPEGGQQTQHGDIHKLQLKQFEMFETSAQPQTAGRGKSNSPISAFSGSGSSATPRSSQSQPSANTKKSVITSVVSKQLSEKLKDSEIFTAVFLPEHDPTIPWNESPAEYHWKWESPGRVKLPMSSKWTKDMIVNGKRTTVPRWQIIQQELAQLKVACQTGRNISKHFKHTVTQYNRKLSQVCNFEILNDKELSQKLTRVLPIIIEYCLDMPYRVGKSIPFLRKGHWHTLYLTRGICASLLANAFLCTIPHDDRDPKQLPHFHFLKLFHEGSEGAPRAQVKVEKIKCVLEYFEQMSNADKAEHDKIISFERKCNPQRPLWNTRSTAMCRVDFKNDDTIEDAVGALQADFANKYIGGGILSVGMVQEEIRFAVCPDLIASRLFTEVLGDDEVMVITGAKQFSTYEGYRTTFKWKKMKTPQKLEVDHLGREMVELVAMDALFFKQGTEWTQYQMQKINRELHKAQVAFSGKQGNDMKHVATGNWGCGAFNGDPQLKFLVQWMAASEVGRPSMVYYTVGSDQQHKEFTTFLKKLLAKKPTVGKIYRALEKYEKGANVQGRNPISVFDFVLKNV